uniref:Uncharacterized protein n=1 Tax=Antarctic circular DNA molecule TaxID=2664238 RepID=A0A5Q2F5B9_9ZZZZ|nr:hypothetical protein [Antarctic circular DNA molecule]
MPYRKTSKKSYKRLSKTVPKSTKRYVKSTIHRMSETKFLTVEHPDIPVTLASTTLLITSELAPGDSSTQRVGDKVEMLSVLYRYTVRASKTLVFVNGDEFNKVRIIFYRWRDMLRSDQVPIISDVLHDLGVTTTRINLMYNQDNLDQGRLHIVSDRTHVLGNYVYFDGGTNVVYTSSDGIKNVSGRFFGKRLGKKYLKYGVTNDANVTESTDQLYCLVVSDSSTLPHPTIDLSMRFFYKDI